MQKTQLIAAFSGTGIITIVVLFVMFQSSSVGVATESFSTFQMSPISFDGLVENSDIIILGTVQKVETKLVDFSESMNLVEEGEEVYQSSPYLFVTVDVEKYFKDNTGETTDSFTFNSFTSGVGERDGEKIMFTTEGIVDYPIGERALFFISDSFLGWTSFGYMHKFNINNDNMIHSAYYEKTGLEEPMNFDLAKERIGLVLERQTIVENYLDTQDAQESIDIIKQELVEESVFLANERTVPTIISSKLKQMYDSGEDLSINKEEIKTQIINSWKQSYEFSPGKGELELSSSTQT